MPKLDVSALPKETGSDYPAPFDAPCAGRVRQRLGDAGGLSEVGINLMHLEPGNWSSQRHWHSHEDEFVYVVKGEVTLVENDGETVLRAGECVAFPKASGNGHHLVNRTSEIASFLEIGTRRPEDVVTYSDIDLMSVRGHGSFVHKDGKAFPKT